MTYVHQPYPKALYSPTGEMKIARNEEEHRAFEAEWASHHSPHVEAEDNDVSIKRGPGRPRKNP